VATLALDLGLKGKNLGYPQRCAHSLQNNHTTQTNTPDRIGQD
jgi:hypothetical protein